MESLDSTPDEALRELIDRARTLLATRENERRKQVLAQIRRLAKEHGLMVEVARPKRPRGRPRKRREATDE
jgi:hypothetical protein